MQLEKDSKLELNDRSRQIGDVITDVESKVRKKYETHFQEQEDKIAELQRQLNLVSARSRRPKRGRKGKEV
ncbi:hypothetical protein EMCG_05071 [[Emmonsia] crescens]|uniref:Uncharacterized protein n=1 Tax=[Emmonsia] crescens TaxID=73230 RepID=A0A0G2IY03_9EURO|nr:hypothetical protein EMCG_05071 [Emmonsia crescens UAMH 3008]